MSDSELGSDDDAMSVDSVTIEEIIMMHVDKDGKLSYLCKTSDRTEEYFDRSDLMDGAAQQKLVLSYERINPPPWDTECVWCEGVGCEECTCDICDRKCRHICGVNYGCVKHPVI